MDNNKLPPLPRVAYGIWLPGNGWLKARDKSGAMIAYAEINRAVVHRYATWIGNGARVEPIDLSLAALEGELLRYEKERIQRSRLAWNSTVQRVKILTKWMGKRWATLRNLKIKRG